MQKMMRVLVEAGRMLLIAVATLVVIDLLAYLALPENNGLTSVAPAYRHTKELRDGVLNAGALTRGYPQHYHVADDTLGFDIAPDAEGLAQIDNGRYQYRAFSNDLGCFSRHQRADYRTGRPYVYFAGDSFTWGYAAYVSKFATVWEELTGSLAAQCGISHSGQRHQFDKFNRVVAAIGVMPAVVVVGFNGNDPTNDAAYPHTTVVEGYLVDTVVVKNGRLVRRDRAQLERAVELRVRELKAANSSRRGRIVNFFKVYSLSANILNRALDSGAAAVRRMTTKPGSAPMEHAAPYDPGRDNVYRYFTPDDTQHRYAGDVKADANKAAILRWRDHAAQNGYRLIFLLIPLKESFGDRTYFAQVTSWMSANGVQFIDLTTAVMQSGMSRDELYWQFDPHFNEAGNRMIGRYLAGIPDLRPGER